MAGKLRGPRDGCGDGFGEMERRSISAIPVVHGLSDRRTLLLGRKILSGSGHEKRAGQYVLTEMNWRAVVRKHRDHAMRAERCEGGRFQNRRHRNTRLMKVIDPGKSAGRQNFRSHLGFDIGMVMRSEGVLSAESRANRLSFNATDDEKLARGKGRCNVKRGLQERSERALNQFSPSTNDPAMWISLHQLSKRGRGL